MPEEKYLIYVVASMMTVTYLARAAPFLLKMGRTRSVLNKVIEYMPVAIIASITVPGLVMAKDGTLLAVNADMLAAIPVSIVAFYTKNLIYSVATGMVTHIAVTLFA